MPQCILRSVSLPGGQSQNCSLVTPAIPQNPYPNLPPNQYSPRPETTEVPSVVAKGMEGDSVLGLEKLGLQCRVKVVEFGGLEWEVGISSELGEPELELGGCLWLRGGRYQP